MPQPAASPVLFQSWSWRRQKTPLSLPSCQRDSKRFRKRCPTQRRDHFPSTMTSLVDFRCLCYLLVSSNPCLRCTCRLRMRRIRARIAFAARGFHCRCNILCYEFTASLFTLQFHSKDICRHVMSYRSCCFLCL
jgi:hypothetical protein